MKRNYETDLRRLTSMHKRIDEELTSLILLFIEELKEKGAARVEPTKNLEFYDNEDDDTGWSLDWLDTEKQHAEFSRPYDDSFGFPINKLSWDERIEIFGMLVNEEYVTYTKEEVEAMGDEVE